jgi:SAM-dependent methyltransferase
MSGIQPVDPATLRRYGHYRRKRFSKEFRFRMLGSVQGKSILDVGCGDGINAMNFALLGANVTGIDVSPKAIELAKRRAAVNGVPDKTKFVCAPLENADLRAHSFDIIWCDAVMHHVIPDLDNVMRRLIQWAKPGAVLMFAEPVNLAPWLRQLRLTIPIQTDATPDERPLEQGELDVIKRYLPDLSIRQFMLFDRLNRFVLVQHNYERSSRARRGIANVLCALDYVALSIPKLRNLGATAVMIGHAEK